MVTMGGIKDALFGKKKTPEENVREWTQNLRKEQRAVERQIRVIEREEQKVVRDMKLQAKKGVGNDVLSILGREVVKSRKAVKKLHASKARLNSIAMQMKEQLAVAKIGGALQSSAVVMRHMNALVKVEAISASMQEMSKEMMKAGIIEEMIDETLSMSDEEELEDEAEAEVNKILMEVTGQMLNGATVGADLPTGEAEAEDNESDLADMQQRLEALKG